MNRRNESFMPSHGWMVANKLRDYLAWIFLAILFLLVIIIAQIRYGIVRDCDDIYDRTFETRSYWITVQAGSMEPECPQPEHS